MSGRMNAAASDDYPFAAMLQQQPPPQPYLGFDHAGMIQSAKGSGQRTGGMMYDSFDFAAAFGKFQQEAPHHQMLALPPHTGGMMYDSFEYAAAFGQFQQEAPHHQIVALPTHTGGMMYDSFDFAAAFGQFQQEAPHHQMMALPPHTGSAGVRLMAPPPMPHHGMQLQMPPMHGGEVYPVLGMVKREGGGVGGTDSGRIGLNHQPPRTPVPGGRVQGRPVPRHYHRRHKVCEYHAKASLVAAGGKQQRFCQQCTRFHVLTEFDEAKRSCPKRLAEHNHRRRKPASIAGTTGAKDSAPPSKKPKAGAVSSSYTADNNNFSVAISSNTSAISCLQQQDQSKVSRPTALTLAAPPPGKEDYHLNDMHLHAQADHHHRHQEQQHFITSLLQHNNNNNGNTNNNILSCSSVCSSVLPAAANGEISDQNNDNDHTDGGNNGNMHLLEVDFM